MKWHDRRSDSGVTAVIVGISAVMLFSVAALAVDLGNAYSRKRDVQNQADFAALAGAGDLPSTGATLCPGSRPAAGDKAVITVTSYLNDNRPQSGDGKSPLVVASQLVDCKPDNGEVSYPTQNKVKVITPLALVKYGLAKVMGFDSTNVSASATVGMGSPGGNAVMPFYAVSGGCGWGPQILSDPAQGHADAGDPPPPLDLATAIDVYATKQKIDSVRTSTAPLVNPAQVYSYAPTGNLEINGPNGMGQENYTKVDAVGFFRDTTQTAYLTSNYRITPATAVAGNSKLIRLSVAALFQAPLSLEDGVWYVRLRVAGKWTPPSPTQALKVGDASLKCPGLSNSGNFGSLRLPRTPPSSVNDMLAKNIALGLQPPLSLAVYPGGYTANPICTSSPTPPRIISAVPSPGLKSGTNCVDTDPGLAANATTEGLITGPSARLVKPTSAGCSTSPGGQSNSVLGRTVNNDILSCFMTTDAKIGTITKSEAVYSGQPEVLSSAIYSSPRFAWVPVLNVPPTAGGSDKYTIVDFRAAFITGETNNSQRNAVQMDTTTNGLKTANNGITAMTVIFFHREALPNAPGDAPLGDYLGVGPKVIQLVD